MAENSAFTYARAFSTAICSEAPEEQQPFVAKTRRIFGYSVDDLAGSVSFIDTLCLLLTGELPDPKAARALETAVVGIMNLGPRDSATRAAMIAGASKSKTQHVLPIGLMAGGGERQGAAEVAKAHKLITQSEDVSELVKIDKPVEFPPGFGQRYSAFDPIMDRLLAKVVNAHPSCRTLSWVHDLHRSLASHGAGIIDTGLIAAVCVSAGIGERESIGVYQIARAAGIFAHGAEQSHKPITAMPIHLDEEVHLVRD